MVERVGAVCWTDGYILFKCSLCNETKKEMTGGHDYELVMRTTANCWVGGGDYMQCKRCGNAALINWKPAIGHQFGPPQPTANNVWMIIHCARVGCGHSEYVPVG